MTEEMRPRVATLVAVMIAEGMDTEEESHYSGLIVQDMKSANQSQQNGQGIKFVLLKNIYPCFFV